MPTMTTSRGRRAAARARSGRRRAHSRRCSQSVAPGTARRADAASATSASTRSGARAVMPRPSAAPRGTARARGRTGRPTPRGRRPSPSARFTRRDTGGRSGRRRSPGAAGRRAARPRRPAGVELGPDPHERRHEGQRVGGDVADQRAPGHARARRGRRACCAPASRSAAGSRPPCGRPGRPRRRRPSSLRAREVLCPARTRTSCAGGSRSRDHAAVTIVSVPRTGR